jgi:exodeoxyribonuclease V alpha subunit
MNALPHLTDPFEARFAVLASGRLREFNEAGVISAADVHVARRLGALGGESDERVLLAVALAVRGPRLGHVHVDLRQIRETAAVEAEEQVDLATLEWPDPEEWVGLVQASPLVGEEAAEDRAPSGAGAERPGAGPAAATTPAAAPPRPLRLSGSRLYLDRYFSEEVHVATTLMEMAARPPAEVDRERLTQGLGRLFSREEDQEDAGQRLAAATAVLRRFAVVAGGPGTGKTTTVARIAALLAEHATAGAPLIALAAPTGKAAARLEEAVRSAALDLDVSEEVREQLSGLEAVTLHRLLGWRPDSNSRFRHNRQRRLPHDVVIVDETSMVSLSLMARLVEALRGEARLVLVGDPGQLASIEAGAVLGDIVGPAAAGPRLSPQAAWELTEVTGAEVGGADGVDGTPRADGARRAASRNSAPASVGDGIIVLRRGHRFGEAIGRLAEAIRSGHDRTVIELLRDPPAGVRWIEADLAEEGDPEPVRAATVRSAREMITAAAAGRADDALAALRGFRILCAHRRGPYGVSTWTARVEGWLEAALPGLNTAERWYVGRPLLVGENDYELGLNNGDSGVIIEDGGRVEAAFERGGGVARFSPARLGSIDTVFAMTIHKSQGSQFGTAAVLLPDPGSRILTRELLYTAATRAQRELTLVGTEETIRAAVRRPVARASGLRDRLWPEVS